MFRYKRRELSVTSVSKSRWKRLYDGKDVLRVGLSWLELAGRVWITFNPLLGQSLG